MNAAQHGATYKGLVYVRRRYITADQLRQAIATTGPIADQAWQGRTGKGQPIVSALTGDADMILRSERP